MARHYAVSDLWFSSVPTQTNPNRAFMACGTSNGAIVNGTPGRNLFLADTIWNRLTEESPNTTWMIFWQVDQLPIIFPGPYTGTNTFVSMNRISDLRNYYQKIDIFHELARNGQLPQFSFIEPQWTTCLNLSTTEKEWADIFFRNQDMLIGLQGNDLHPPGDVHKDKLYRRHCCSFQSWRPGDSYIACRDL